MSEYERELGWDDTIEKESEYIILPPGEYEFMVTAIDRERHEGSGKLPPCPKAVVTVEINSPQGKATIKSNLFLHTKTEGMLSAFFGSIGLKKKDEPLKMEWNKALGKKGRCKVSVRDWTTKDGQPAQSNDIRFIRSDEVEPAQQAAWKPGAF